MDACPKSCRKYHIHWWKIHSFPKSEFPGRKRKNENSKAIVYFTMRQYGTACIYLCQHQKSLNMTANSHQRDCPAFNVLFTSVKLDENEKHWSFFEDRGVGTMQDRYSSVEELSRIANCFLSGNSSYSTCFWAVLFFTHFFLMRGESVRKLELEGMFILHLENKDPATC